MRFTKLMTAAAVAVSLSSVPVMAQAAQTPAATKLSQLSGQNVRSGAAMQNESEARGGSLILALIAAGLIIAGIIIAVGGGDDEPQSP